MRFPIHIATAIFISVGLSTAFAGRQERVDLDTLKTPVYNIEGDAFVGQNGDRYWNRPLYCNNIHAVVLAGDKPVVQLASDNALLGTMMFALVRNGHGTWLQDAGNLTSQYRPDRMDWIVTDPSWGGTTITLEAVPAAKGPGMAVGLSIAKAQPGDQIVWVSGAAKEAKRALWNFDMTSGDSGAQKLMTRGFSPEDCAGDHVAVSGSGWTLQGGGSSPVAIGECGPEGKIAVSDAGGWKQPESLMNTGGGSSPVAAGEAVVTGKAMYWALLGPGAETDGAPQQVFADGLARTKSFETVVHVESPDPWLTAAVGASVAANDGVFRNGIYTHAGMRWSSPLLGWRTLFGATAYGAHQNVKTDASIFIAKQIKTSDKNSPQPDPAAEMASQGPNSRMFGKGRVDYDQPHHYDMQTQFFDQVEHAWNWTGDAELEALLRPALELQCEYIQQCFDPEMTGIYESYANTWPTDDQFYNGGGTSEETAYAYHAEVTAMRLDQRAGDAQDAATHRANAQRIHDAFFKLLWIPAEGHPGAYREQYGLKRLHENPWLYAIFCPIDAGLLTQEQAAESLQFTETGLERVQMPYGGEECWPSNWVPSIWSVREMWAGDDYQLALAYFQTGLGDDGWKVLRGMFPETAMFGNVPGDMGHAAGGTDFNDCNSMFGRAVVEGLFGFRPDYADGQVLIAPQLPSTWDHASIRTPDFSLKYQRTGPQITESVSVAHKAALEVDVPVTTHKIVSVTVNHQPAQWTAAPGFGQSVVRVKIPATATASGDIDIAVTCQDALAFAPSAHLAGNTGDKLNLPAGDGTIEKIDDPEGVLTGIAKSGDGASATAGLTANAGDHSVFVETKTGDLEQWRIFKIHVTDQQTDAAAAAKRNVAIATGAQFNEVPIGSVLNGDIRTIYKQQYLSPRPATTSLRLTTDGYNTWQMILQKNHTPPEIGLDNIAKLNDGRGGIRATNGVPFVWATTGNNIAFTSGWDNFPKQVDVPVNTAGKAVWFLVCGTTNPMEVRIANAELRMTYADGSVERLPLVPPLNFWTLCPIDGVDYDYHRDGFALPKQPPMTMQLGKNCRAIVLGWNLRPGAQLKSVSLACESNQVTIGLMGVTVMQ
jgi:hypothetical protein